MEELGPTTKGTHEVWRRLSNVPISLIPVLSGIPKLYQKSKHVSGLEDTQEQVHSFLEVPSLTYTFVAFVPDLL